VQLRAHSIWKEYKIFWENTLALCRWKTPEMPRSMLFACVNGLRVNVPHIATRGSRGEQVDLQSQVALFGFIEYSLRELYLLLLGGPNNSAQTKYVGAHDLKWISALHVSYKEVGCVQHWCNPRNRAGCFGPNASRWLLWFAICNRSRRSFHGWRILRFWMNRFPFGKEGHWMRVKNQIIMPSS